VTERWLLPASILGGSVIIALGLYFGLSARVQPPTPTGSTSAIGAASGTPSPASVPVPSSPSPDVRVEDPAALAVRDKQTVDASLRALHAGWVEKCWKPALTHNPTPSRSRYAVNVSFDAAGRQVILGISELRGESRPDVGQCLRQQVLSLSVEPGAGSRNVSTEILFP